MGFYYDWLEERWTPVDHDRKLTRATREQIRRRGELIEELITEIETSRDGMTLLYASLLARTLAASDELLMREYGKRIAELAVNEKDKRASAKIGMSLLEGRHAHDPQTQINRRD
jgi:hypothetical protein